MRDKFDSIISEGNVIVYHSNEEAIPAYVFKINEDKQSMVVIPLRQVYNVQKNDFVSVVGSPVTLRAKYRKRIASAVLVKSSLHMQNMFNGHNVQGTILQIKDD